MKKILALILALALCLSLCACGADEAPAASVQEKEESPAPVEQEEAGDESAGVVEVEEKLFDVVINIPASFFEEESAEEIMANAEEQGIKKCEIHDDGSVTYTMSKQRHGELMEEFYADAEESFASMLEGEGAVASFVDIQHNENLSEINVTVNDQYTVWDMFNGFAFYILGAYYQIFDGADPDTVDVVVNFIDESGAVKDSMSYREFMDNSAETDAAAEGEG